MNSLNEYAKKNMTMAVNVQYLKVQLKNVMKA